MKRVKVTRAKHQQNAVIKSGIKAATKKLEKAVASGDKAAVEAQSVQMISTVDKAASKGIMHKNKANRKKAQIAKRAAAV